MAHELAAALDQRARALGDQLAASPEPWLASQLGVLAPHASPLLREDYARRAGAAATYREAAGITDPGQAIAPEPHHGNPELDHLRQAAIRALEIRDETEITRAMTNGELEARILDGHRALVSAPPDVSRQLRLTAQAEADAWQQSADAQAKHDQTGSAGATALARHAVPQPEAEPMPEPGSSPGAGQAADGRLGLDDQAARLDRLVGQALGAAQRLTAENAAREARAGYVVGLERHAHAESEHIVQAQASYEPEIEL